MILDRRAIERHIKLWQCSAGEDGRAAAALDGEIELFKANFRLWGCANALAVLAFCNEINGSRALQAHWCCRSAERRSVLQLGARHESESNYDQVRLIIGQIDRSIDRWINGDRFKSAQKGRTKSEVYQSSWLNKLEDCRVSRGGIKCSVMSLINLFILSRFIALFVLIIVGYYGW